MKDRKSDEKESQELKDIYNRYLNKRSEIKKNTQFTVEDVFGDIKSRDSIPQEQIKKPNSFFYRK